MKFLLASLLAASTFAETYELINEDSDMIACTFLAESCTTPFTWSGQSLTLTTTEIGADEMQFCINAVAPNAGEGYGSSFALYWTDGVEYVGNWSTAMDGLWFFGSELSDMGRINDTHADESEDWTLISEERTCDDDGTCVFDTCASRPLQTADSNDYTLPIRQGSTIIAVFYSGDFEGVTYTHLGAMSLGLMILTTAAPRSLSSDLCRGFE